MGFRWDFTRPLPLTPSEEERERAKERARGGRRGGGGGGGGGGGSQRPGTAGIELDPETCLQKRTCHSKHTHPTHTVDTEQQDSETLCTPGPPLMGKRRWQGGERGNHV